MDRGNGYFIFLASVGCRYVLYFAGCLNFTFNTAIPNRFYSVRFVFFIARQYVSQIRKYIVDLVTIQGVYEMIFEQWIDIDLPQ